ncbi:MAG TPA: ABC transporter ATP-binding protein [Phycisphaerales bacterium]|nr:ABC transporter ATP-binding protein [Phycisphaerales bacterium]HRQ74357.1 ABC transporter ATP-binding protein [Phycisphaerales bacterium]
MITIKALTKKYGSFHAVDNLSCSVGNGEAVALWGSNGAGKTTVLRCVLGLLRYSGIIEIAGLDIRASEKATREKVGYVPQELAFHDDLRLLETMHFFSRLRRAASTRVATVLDEVGLSPTVHGRKRIRELSGGMKQRMALALALLSDPPLLILDELTSNLDTKAQCGFMELLRRQKLRGRTLFFTSHRLDEIEAVADRVIVLGAGRRQFECTPYELARRLGLQCTLHVFLPPEQLDDAVGELARCGFDATRNGVSLSVQVAANEKAVPIRVLSEASIRVRDFDFTSSFEAGGRI